MKYSIVVPTRNNQGKLTKCLQHIASLNKPAGGFEVIVVDNGSTDQTATTAGSYSFVRYFHDEVPGLHRGRHLGAKEAKGEIVCYIDDDSFVDANWLVAIEQTFSATEVKLACGNNLPLFESEPPKWLDFFWIECPYGRFMTELSLLEFHQKPMKVPTWYAFGCNFIVRKDVIYEFGGFNPDGMPENMLRYRGDGETALSCRLNQAGEVAYFNPGISIRHFVPDDRLSPAYFKGRAYRQGISDSYTRFREENGFDYGGFEPNRNVDQVEKKSWLERKRQKMRHSLSRKLNKKSHHEYLEIKKVRDAAFEEGSTFHRREVEGDPKLAEWVLKTEYMEP